MPSGDGIPKQSWGVARTKGGAPPANQSWRVGRCQEQTTRRTSMVRGRSGSSVLIQGPTVTTAASTWSVPWSVTTRTPPPAAGTTSRTVV